MIKKILPYQEVLLKMEYYCSYQERCEYDIKVKLDSYELTLVEKNKIIQHLKQNEFLDNQRFANSLVRGKVSLKKDGIQKIKNTLYTKKIAPDIIQQALNSINTDLYSDNILHLIARKYPLLLTKNDKKSSYQKTLQYLINKGYQYEECKSNLDNYLKNNS